MTLNFLLSEDKGRKLHKRKKKGLSLYAHINYLLNHTTPWILEPFTRPLYFRVLFVV